MVMVVMAGVVRAGKRPFHGGGKVPSPAKAVKHFGKQASENRTHPSPSKVRNCFSLNPTTAWPSIRMTGVLLNPSPTNSSVAAHVALDVRH
jgi:hypothetical protein